MDTKAVSRARARARWALPLAVTLTGAAQQPAESALIAWSPNRTLTWSQYRGRPDLSAGAAAVFTFRVVSHFEGEKSWVTAGALASGSRSAQLLVHEQGHFDSSEVQARQLRRALRELSDPCGRPTE